MHGKISAILVALGLGVTSAYAQTNEVGGENIVGYYKVEMPSNGGRFVCALSLQAIDATNQNLMGVLGSQLRTSALPGSGDRVWLGNADGSLAGYSRKSSDGLYHSLDDWFGPATNPALPVGSGFWLQSAPISTNRDIIIMGEVIAAPITNIAIQRGYQILGYPFSTEASMQTFGLTNGTASTGYGASDFIMRWDVSNQVYSVFVLRPGGVWTSLTAGASYSIQLGEGFWYYAQTNFTWTETNSYINNL